MLFTLTAALASLNIQITFSKEISQETRILLRKVVCVLIMIIPLSFQEFDQASPRLYTRTPHRSLAVRVHAHWRTRLCVCVLGDERDARAVNTHHRYSWNRNRMTFGLCLFFFNFCGKLAKSAWFALWSLARCLGLLSLALKYPLSPLGPARATRLPAIALFQLPVAT